MKILKLKLKPLLHGTVMRKTDLPLKRLILLLLHRPELREDLCEHQRSSEDKDGAEPVIEGEGVVEVDDGEEEADELAERHY